VRGLRVVGLHIGVVSGTVLVFVLCCICICICICIRICSELVFVLYIKFFGSWLVSDLCLVAMGCVVPKPEAKESY